MYRPGERCQVVASFQRAHHSAIAMRLGRTLYQSSHPAEVLIQQLKPCQRVFLVRIESGGDQNEIRFVPLQCR